MDTINLSSILGATDIYLIDGIVKGRYGRENVLLDAGCGGGRNLYWFLQNGFSIYGIDQSAEAIEALKEKYPDLPEERFRVEALEQTSFEDAFFDSIICSAVLHFATDTAHFFKMMTELVRLLKPGGSLFIRMASTIGIEEKVQAVGEGVYFLPDGSYRFLLTRPLLAQLLSRYPLSFIEDFKTVNVADLRCMSTLVLQKEQYP
ncbi:MAG TPA: class I SAM-dependent methyltransferase [Flavisolibacter sp.]|jgi:2-polyprenyl-3-methyl-5-hydroxy-6-metoxy-1,4-benzoquinol methylase|nr:class I SAM-dependent methyltransferase [Flavisolibacter sp.]